MVVFEKDTRWIDIGVTYPQRPGSTTQTTWVLDKDNSLSSQDNRHWRRRLKKGYPFVGGPFESIKKELEVHPTAIHTVVSSINGSANDPIYVGAFRPTLNPPAVSNSLVNLDAWGPTAFARMKPTKPSFAGLNFIFELRELPEMLKQRFTKDLLGASKKHLQVQFGWRPLLSDLQKLINLQREAEKKLRWLIEHNGQPVRRKITLAADTTSSGPSLYGTPSKGALWPNIQAQAWIGNQYSYLSTTEISKIWASARFRYQLPPGPRDIDWNNKMLSRLYGGQLSPSVVYNAIPWTWLADWFSNLGDMISNYDPGVADRCYADYFYIMGSVERYARLDVHGTLLLGKSGEREAVSASTIRRFSHKKRVVGDPFGFNTAPGSLSEWQLSILGALGLSRLR